MCVARYQELYQEKGLVVFAQLTLVSKLVQGAPHKCDLQVFFPEAYEDNQASTLFNETIVNMNLTSSRHDRLCLAVPCGMLLQMAIAH